MSTRPGEIKVVPHDGNEALATSILFDGTRGDFLEANYAAEEELKRLGNGHKIVLPEDLHAEDLIQGVLDQE